MLDIIVQLGSKKYSIEPTKIEQVVTALGRFGYKPEVRVYVAATEGDDFEMLRTVLDNMQIEWGVVARKLHTQETANMQEVSA